MNPTIVKIIDLMFRGMPEREEISAMREELLTWGTRVKAEVVDVRVDHTIRVNRRSPLVAKVRCTLPSGEVTLRSPRLWDECPATGDTVEVIYDPMDERRYVIEFPEE